MYRRTIALAVLMACLAYLPVTVSADGRKYTPPPRKGTIYIVVNFKPYSSRDQMKMDEKTKVSVKWGSYSRSASYGRGRLSLRLKDGFVVALRHMKDDSYQMSVESEGTIISVAQSDSPPSQWNDSKYDTYNW